MKKITLFGTILCAVIILTGCKIKIFEPVKCSAPDTSILDWFPYENADTFIMESSENMQNFTVGDITFEYREFSEFLDFCGGCTNYFRIDISCPSQTFHLHITHKDNIISIENINIVLFYKNEEQEICVEGLLFDKFLDTASPMAVFSAEKENQLFQSITFEKNVGIINIMENENWILQNPKEKSSNKDKVMKIVDCFPQML
ncbi:MAG: hypothetical protein LBN95_09970 [Prevotellaceae bacterium]|jgi:hypothetical protein|nr:hypothetical protein [Prevotellaceae bacterium]